MDALFLSRLQFAVTPFIHFLFVPLTIGLALMLAIMETQYARTGDGEYRRMARFWGKLFLINFTIGIVTGIVLEFQFGMNWSRYSEYVGDIFGSLLAIEATGFFFLESTMIGVWIFGWDRLSPKAHAAVMWLVCIATCGSAFWILTANAWMQHPVGFTLRNGRAELTDLTAILLNPAAIWSIVHTISASWLVGAFFVMGISAGHLLRKNEVPFFVALAADRSARRDTGIGGDAGLRRYARRRGRQGSAGQAGGDGVALDHAGTGADHAAILAGRGRREKRHRDVLHPRRIEFTGVQRIQPSGHGPYRYPQRPASAGGDLVCQFPADGGHRLCDGGRDGSGLAAVEKNRRNAAGSFGCWSCSFRCRISPATPAGS